MKKKQILFITREIVPFYYGGIGTQFKAVAKFLKRQGHEVAFLTRKPSDFDEVVYQQNYGDMALFFVDAPEMENFVSFSVTGGLVSTYNMAYALAVSRKFDEICNANYPDIVIVAEYGAEGLFLLLKSKTGDYLNTRFILTINGMLFNVISTYESGVDASVPSELNDPQNRAICAMEDLCVLLADEIATPSVSAWSTIQERIGINKHAHYIPNFLDTDLFDKYSVVKQTSRSDRLILFVGRLDRLKGADVLLQAFIHIIVKQDVEIVFIGRDSFWKEYECTFLEYWDNKIPISCRAKIKFIGQIDHRDVVSYFKKATVCVFPSRCEVFGIGCLEAMYYGCPVLVSKGTGLEEVIGSDFADYTFNSSDGSSSLEDKLIAFLKDASHHESLGVILHQRAEELIRMSETRLLQLIAMDSNSKNAATELPLPKLFENGLRIFEALNEIILHIGSDFMKLTDNYDLDDLKLREILLIR
ncbi:glycosyltransferase family 4 protein [Desulfococcaceae bacterium HSG7]|nr:glycosyltransferase family 4 protein [Desulfococcaceae bacterium HSG7]